MTCPSYIPCHAPFDVTSGSFRVSDLNMLPGSRQFYETQRLYEFNAASAQMGYLLTQKSEQYYLLSGINNALGVPDKDISAMIQASVQKGEGLTDFGCLACDSLAELAIKEKKITDAQKVQYIMQCAQKNLEAFMDLNKDGRDNTTFAAQKQCFMVTCQEATLTHAAYSMNALSDLLRIHARMRQLLFTKLPEILYTPCVDDMSVFSKRDPLKVLGEIANLAETFGANLGVFGAAFSLRLSEMEMPVMGCVNRNMTLIQQLEADRTLLLQYKNHLEKLKTMSDSLNTICHDPSYRIWQNPL